MVENPQVLIAILNNLHDFAVARDQHWYRIPVTSVDKWLRNRWPPEWLAFYHTKIFGQQAFRIHYYARVLDVRQVRRWQLFPDEAENSKSQHRYYQLFFEPLRQLPHPIFSRRLRRIVFIPTTWNKFINAVEINDLYDESPLEDTLWTELQRRQVHVERQEFVSAKGNNYALDFAVYCIGGKIDVETDGDTWHANPEKAAEDNYRDNALKTTGWKVLRFNTRQISEETVEYCVPTILENINKFGGVDEGRLLPRKFRLDGNDDVQQMGLFD